MNFGDRFRDFRLWCLIGAALVLALVAVKPTMRMTRSVYHYFIVFDVTQSQNAEDYLLDGKPISRLAFAKHAVRKAIRDLPCGSSVGIGVFAGYDISAYGAAAGDIEQAPMPREPAVIAPFFVPIEVCRNFSLVDRAVEQIDWRMAWSDGSEVASGLYATVKKAKSFNNHTKVVFITDGEEVPESGYILAMPGQKGEVRGLIVGSGGLAPSRIPKYDDAGYRKGFLADRSRLDEGRLKKLEAETGLRYARLESAKKFSADLRVSEFAEREEVDTDIRLPLAALALVLVLIAVLL